MKKFRQEFEELINKNSLENQSDTPDFVLAEFLLESLRAFDRATNARESWYGRKADDINHNNFCASATLGDVPKVTLEDLKSKNHNHVFKVDVSGACTTCGKTVADILNEPADFRRLTRFTQEEVEIVVAWMNTWEQLKGTAIPMRFAEDFGKPIKKN